jgi:acyl-homoserine-lactone acylase
MESHGNLLLKLYGQARGRAAEYWGERHLNEDRYVRTMGIPARAAEWYQAQDPAFKTNLDAFADGVNRYAREHADQLADSLEVVLPITATDVLAHAQRVIHFTFVHGQNRIFEMIAPASNMWAIAPSRSASGHAMLLANPHLPWADFMLFYESQWEGPGVNIYGATLVGFPVPAIAFNDKLGWSHTVNTYDGTDLYRLTPVAGGYRWDGGVKPFESNSEIIKVKTPSGLREDTLVVRRSVHGPIVKDSAGVVLAARVAGLDQPGMLAQWWAMGRSQDLTQFEAALRTLQVPMFNVMYADQAGHILYTFGGRVPVRSCCDAAYWAGVVPGDSSGNLWTTTLGYDQLPRLLDPATGWLQNTNDPPWTSTVPLLLDPAKFPAWLSPVGMHFRAQRSVRMLVKDSSITFDELVAYKHSTRMELADRVLDELVAAAKASGRPLAARAAQVLSVWDRQAQAESRGAVLFSFWIQAVIGRGRSPFAVEWRPDSVLTTPHGLADPKAAVAALEVAAAMVEQRYGALDVPWGEVMRIRYAGIDQPGNGAPGDPVGVFRVAQFIPASDGKFRVVHGDTYYAAIEFGPTVRAKVLLSYGNSTQPGSPHMGDQIALFVKQEMRDAWRTKSAVAANLELRETLK